MLCYHRHSSIEDKMKEYGAWWLEYLKEMDDTIIAKQIFHYTLRGRRDISCPRQRWKVKTGAGTYALK